MQRWMYSYSVVTLKTVLSSAQAWPVLKPSMAPDVSPCESPVRGAIAGSIA